MNINEARLIREIKKGCTYRRLAEIYYLEHDVLHGKQFSGEDLCKQALNTLYPNVDLWGMEYPEKRFGKNFKEDNLSYFGNFYWWE